MRRNNSLRNSHISSITWRTDNKNVLWNGSPGGKTRARIPPCTPRRQRVSPHRWAMSAASSLAKCPQPLWPRPSCLPSRPATRATRRQGPQQRQQHRLQTASRGLSYASRACAVPPETGRAVMADGLDGMTPIGNASLRCGLNELQAPPSPLTQALLRCGSSFITPGLIVRLWPRALGSHRLLSVVSSGAWK